jgi:dinuclear metal center YbgI/SA1388 family protein
MTELGTLVRYLDEELRTSEVPDSEAALNGLQLGNSGMVKSDARLLLVHHGMFWRSQRLVGAALERLRDAITADLAVYSSHIPLDLHPTFGNNALLARELHLEAGGGFGRYRGVEIGVMGSCDLKTASVVERVRAFSQQYGTTVVNTAFAPDRKTRRFAVNTGAGASTETLEEAQERGVDTLIVGEGPHHTAVQAAEQGLVVIYAGHYATETLGVQALAQHLGDRFGLPWTFVNVPTGL